MKNHYRLKKNSLRFFFPPFFQKMCFFPCDQLREFLEQWEWERVKARYPICELKTFWHRFGFPMLREKFTNLECFYTIRYNVESICELFIYAANPKYLHWISVYTYVSVKSYYIDSIFQIIIQKYKDFLKLFNRQKKLTLNSLKKT